MTISAIDVAAQIAWAIQPQALEQLLAIAGRWVEADFEVLEAKLGRPLENSYAMTERNGVAILPIQGPLFPRANLFTRISNATSLDLLARDLTAAIENPAIKGILLNIDSPGGDANGISELAQMISASRASKPIAAYVSHMGASGAYWLAAAADQIIAADTAHLGSIGVVMAHSVDKDAKRVEIVSSHAPHKRLDATTDAGRAKLQSYVDSLEAVFVKSVAKYRGVSSETVLRDFGQGALLLGQTAVDAQMVDAVGTFESVLAGLAGSTKRSVVMTTAKAADQPAITVDLIKKDYPDVAAALVAEGVKSVNAEALAVQAAEIERQRIQNVYAQGKQLVGHEALIESLMFDGKTTGPEAAVQILAAERKARDAGLKAFREEAPPPVAYAGEREGQSLNRKAFDAMEPKNRKQFLATGGQVVD